MTDTELRQFISNELERIAEEYKIPESRVALYAGKRFIWFNYCTKERAYALEKLQGDQLLDEIIKIAAAKKSEEEFDYAAFFHGVDGDLMEDFATLQLSQLPIWDELEKYLETDKKI